VSVVYDQQVLWTKSFGVTNTASGTPVAPDTLFRIGMQLFIY
jgi:CubicO group peptidase (beta-lactamase class C family)